MSDKKVAVIFNPVKIGNENRFKTLVETNAEAAGYGQPSYFETTEEDPGYSMTQAAIDAQADLVLVAGGDGTVRVVCGELVKTSIPVAVIPAGTGNLLARNLDIPLDLKSAIELAFTGKPSPIDAVQVVADDKEPAIAMGISGVGFDAKLMDDTDEDLKKIVGHTAYVATFMKNVNAPLRKVTYQVDDQHKVTRKAALFLVGNISSIQAGIQLIKDADPTDGKIDLLVASPEGLGGWARLAAKIFRRSKSIQIHQGRQIKVKLKEPTLYELDGDTQGEATRLTFTSLPGAVLVVQPEK